MSDNYIRVLDQFFCGDFSQNKGRGSYHRRALQLLLRVEMFEALRQLGELHRSRRENLDAIEHYPPFKRFIDDLLTHLPVDTGAEVSWSADRTLQLIASFSDLKLEEVSAAP